MCSGQPFDVFGREDACYSPLMCLGHPLDVFGDLVRDPKDCYAITS